MATKYLDTSGLQYLWSKIKTWAKRVLVSSISYDGDAKAIKMTKYDGTNDTEHTTQVVSAATIVSDGGGITSHQDISGKADKVSGATNGNFASLNSSGNLVDSGHKHSDYLTQHQDISGKADKVGNATQGNFASLDNYGNLVDSGYSGKNFATSAQGALADTAYQKPSGGIPSTDLSSGVQASLALADSALQSHQDISGKADKAIPNTAGNIAKLNSSGNLVDGGILASELVTFNDISDKADKVSDAISGHVASLDSKGNLQDSGFTLGKSVPSYAVFTDTKDTTGIGSILYTPEFDTLVDGGEDIKRECYVPFHLVSLSDEGKELDVGSIGMTLTGRDVLKIQTIVAKKSNIINIGQTNLFIGGDQAVTNHNTVVMTNKTLTSPILTGIPVAPTASAGTNTTQIATTAFVTSAISTASGSYVSSSSVGAASGVCPLDSNSKIDSQYLPSYVDDVIEAYARTGQTELSSTWLATGSASGSAITPETGKIYLLMNDTTNYSANTQFRWSGTTYVKLNDGGVSAITNAEIDSITNN